MPPTPQPTCGYVGQLLSCFSPCRTNSSDKMSNVPKPTPVLLSASTTFLLNPQRGVSGLPFMNSITGCFCTSASSCCFCSAVSAAGAAPGAGAAAGGAWTKECSTQTGDIVNARTALGRERCKHRTDTRHLQDKLAGANCNVGPCALSATQLHA